MFGISEIAIILIVVILVLGAKRLPDLARSAGKSARILKAEAKAMKESQGAEGEAGAPRVIRGEAVDRQDSGDSKTDMGQSPGRT
ncbi:twin-arginine translocase TatA/TatE family subunit [Streptomyces atratus]|uniref:Sec-independent protein translocase protein TatA n=1 Tax=Streptomyces atratus TaxID=1893 RepID=A0A2Z5J7L4_STRAR|nr:twin-arginine translocase TatA/TatE family subunit [Streptomyces atratus]AXE76304.1 Sec-independent protein translocase TatA [Streptomyces atratus]